MPSASSPYFLSKATAGPDSPKQSCMPIVFTGVGALRESVSHTAAPSPPITECSSTVTTLPHSFAAATTSSSSRGLIVCIFMTFAFTPSAASFYAAASDSATHKPVAMIATSVPSRSVTPFPISNLYSALSFIIGVARRPNLMYTGPSYS